MDVDKFKLSELFSNDTGKTSMSALMGGLSVLCSCIGFIMGVFNKNSEVLSTSMFFCGAGCALLGVRKFVNNKESVVDDTQEKT